MSLARDGHATYPVPVAPEMSNPSWSFPNTFVVATVVMLPDAGGAIVPRIVLGGGLPAGPM